MASQTRYVAYGPVSGACRHLHRTLTGAHRCVCAGIRQTAALPGYATTDQEVMRWVNGSPAPLSRSEREDVEVLWEEAAR